MIEVLTKKVEGNTDVIPISEIFYSLEGEGPLAGMPTLFIRTFGCNLKCPGFNAGMAGVQGCDTPYSWSKDHVSGMRRLTIDEVVEESIALLQSKIPFLFSQSAPMLHVSLTGGEPLLHVAKLAQVLAGLYNKLGPRSKINVLIETNTTQVLPENIFDVPGWQGDWLNIIFSCSPKLVNSGEPESKTNVPQALASYLLCPVTGGIYLKFVSDGSEQVMADIFARVRGYATYLEEIEFQELEEAYSELLMSTILMPEGTTKEQLDVTYPLVAEQALRHNMRFSPRLHVNIWNNKKGT